MALLKIWGSARRFFSRIAFCAQMRARRLWTVLLLRMRDLARLQAFFRLG